MVGITLFVPHKAEKKAVSSLLSNSANRDIEVLKSCIPLHTNLRRFWEGSLLDTRPAWRFPASLLMRCLISTSVFIQRPTLLHTRSISGAILRWCLKLQKSEGRRLWVPHFILQVCSSKKGKLAFYCHFGRIRFSFAWLPLDESSVIILGGGGQLSNVLFVPSCRLRRTPTLKYSINIE